MDSFEMKERLELSAISEESNEDDYEDVSSNEEEEEEEEDNDDELGEEEEEGEEEEGESFEEDGSRLQLKNKLLGHTARVKGLQELRELYHRVNHRLTWAKEEEECRLKKAEDKVSNAFEETGDGDNKGKPNDEGSEKNELKVFEKMEKLTGRPSFGSKMSIVEQFMADKMCLDSTVSEISEDEVVEVEEPENNLLDAKEAFERYKIEEESKLEKQRTQLSNELIKFDRVRNELGKLKKLNSEYIAKNSQLQEQLKNSNLEWSKKSNSWNLARTRMKTKIEELETKCKTLEEKLAKSVNKVTNPVKPLTNTNSDTAFQRTKMKTKIEELETKCKTLEEKLAKSVNKDTTVTVKPSLLTNANVGCSNDSKLDGAIETVFPNGTRKYICKAKQFTRTMYKNGDIKEKRADGSIHYFFATYGLRHYVYPNGLEMTTYKKEASGQIQRKNPDGTTEVLYPNGFVKVIRSDGKEDFIFPDNTMYQTDDNGNTVILLPNGQKEIHNEFYKQRIYPDGTTKTVYSDGSTETKYCNGRIRVKNADGKLISDTHQDDGSFASTVLLNKSKN